MFKHLSVSAVFQLIFQTKYVMYFVLLQGQNKYIKKVNISIWSAFAGKIINFDTYRRVTYNRAPLRTLVPSMCQVRNVCSDQVAC